MTIKSWSKIFFKWSGEWVQQHIIDYLRDSDDKIISIKSYLVKDGIKTISRFTSYEYNHLDRRSSRTHFVYFDGQITYGKKIYYYYDVINSNKPVKPTHDLYKIFPNPTTGIINIRSQQKSQNITKVDLYNTSGNRIKTQIVSGQNAYLDLSDFPSGSYFIRLSNDKNVLTKHILIEH